MNRNFNYLFVYCTFVQAENSLNDASQCVNVVRYFY